MLIKSAASRRGGDVGGIRFHEFCHFLSVKDAIKHPRGLCLSFTPFGHKAEGLNARWKVIVMFSGNA